MTSSETIFEVRGYFMVKVEESSPRFSHFSDHEITFDQLEFLEQPQIQELIPLIGDQLKFKKLVPKKTNRKSIQVIHNEPRKKFDRSVVSTEYIVSEVMLSIKTKIPSL